MKLPKRFALSTLLLLMLAVAVVFGYIQWRRQWMRSEVEALNTIGSEWVTFPNDYRYRVRTFEKLVVGGRLWPTITPQPLKVWVKIQPSCMVQVGGKDRHLDEAKSYLSQLLSRL